MTIGPQIAGLFNWRNEMHKRRGFTLIEVMVVVAIIGILAAISIPMYRDYAARAKLAEASTATAAARTAIAEAFNTGSLAAESTNDTLGLPAPDASATRYVKSVTAAGKSPTEATVTAVIRNTGNADIDDKSIIWTMTCNDANCKTEISGDVPAKYLPKP